MMDFNIISLNETFLQHENESAFDNPEQLNQTTALPTETVTNPNLFEAYPGYCVSEDDTWKHYHTVILSLGSSLLISVGTVGNTLTYFVLRQKGYRNNVLASALRYLAVTDTIILWTVVFNIFIKGTMNIDTFSISYGICAASFCVKLILTSIDHWLLVYISIVRLFHLTCPFKAQSVCKKADYYIWLSIVHFLIILIHGAVFTSIYLQFPSNEELNELCYFALIKTKNKFFVTINMTVNFAGPVIALFVIHILMLEIAQRPMHAISRRFSRAFSSKGANTSQNAITFDLETSQTSHNEEVNMKYNGQYKAIIIGDGSDFCETSASNGIGYRDNNLYARCFDMAKAPRNTAHLRGNRGEDLFSSVLGHQPESGSKQIKDLDRNTNKDPDATSHVSEDAKSTTSSKHSGKQSRHSRESGPGVPRLTIDAIGSESDPPELQMAQNEDRPITVISKPSETQNEIQSKNYKHDNRINSLTRLLLVANFIFFSINVPFWVFHAKYAKSVLRDIKDCYLKELVVYSVFLIRYSSHCVNFYFYCASGSRFRRDFIAWVRHIRIKRNARF